MLASGFRRAVALALLVSLGNSVARTEEAVALRYKFEPQAALAYKVVVRADDGDEVTVMSGTPEFKVQSADAQGTKLYLANIHLSQNTQRKPGVRAGFPRPPRIPPLRFPGSPLEFHGHEVTLDERGNVIQERGKSSLNYLLGSLASLIFEPFPEKPQATWSRTERTTISITARSDRFPSPFREPAESERLTAEETTIFTLQSATDKLVKLKREHALHTFEKSADGPRLELELAGTYVFDREAGLPQELSYEGKLISRKDNVTYRAPLSVSVHRLSAEELQALREELAQRAEEAKARAEQAALERKAPLTDQERGVILANLQDEDKNKVREALGKLKNKEPAQDDKEIAFNVALVLEDGDRLLRQPAVEALEKWATRDQADALVKAAGDSQFFIAQAALRGLARIQEPKTYPVIAARLGELAHRANAAQCLKKIGTDAEEAVVEMLQNADWGARMEACNVLKEIGGEKSLPLLEALAKGDSNGLVKIRAREAADAVGKRK
jgi:hypothetical protein